MDPNKLSVLIPYEDFAELMSLAEKFRVVEREHKQMQKQYLAMMKIYSEILEKVAEIDRYL